MQGAKAEEKRQLEMAEAIKAGADLPPRIVHEGFNQLQGVSGAVVSWVPEELANKMFNLGADYQITEVSAHEALQQAETIAESIVEDLQTTQVIQLLNLLGKEKVMRLRSKAPRLIKGRNLNHVSRKHCHRCLTPAGIVLLILIIYLISRVNDLEAKLFLIKGRRPQQKKTENEPQKVFGGLNGRQLWDEWVSMANGGDDLYGIKGDRDRFWPCLNCMSARSSRPARNMAPWY